MHLRLSLRPDGRLRVFSSAAPDEEVVFDASPNSKVKRGRWTHLSLVWYPKKGGNPNLSKRVVIRRICLASLVNNIGLTTFVITGLYLDGAFVEGAQLSYPRLDSISGNVPGVQYLVGDLSYTPNETDSQRMSWCVASAYLLGLPLRKRSCHIEFSVANMPLADDIPRLIHHLGPRYTGSFQDPSLVRFLTYEAATSLNMYLASVSSLHSSLSPVRSPTSEGGNASSNKRQSTSAGQPRPGTIGAPTPILKALREGMQAIGVREESVLFGLAPAGFGWGVDSTGASSQESQALGGSPVSRRASGNWTDHEKEKPPGEQVRLSGDVFVVKAESLDVALWKIGGAAVALRLVSLGEVRGGITNLIPCANFFSCFLKYQTPHELSRSLAILSDGLKNSWQNSEDMERMRTCLDSRLRP